MKWPKWNMWNKQKEQNKQSKMMVMSKTKWNGRKYWNNHNETVETKQM